MTDTQRKKLHARLMQFFGDQLPPGSIEWKITDESITQDVIAIEPLIDEMIREGKREIFKAIHEITFEEQKAEMVILRIGKMYGEFALQEHGHALPS